MENSVTLTLARYHDLIDIERDFQKVYHEKHGSNIEGLRNQNHILKNRIQEQKEEIRKWKSFSFFGIIWIIILMITIYSSL